MPFLYTNRIESYCQLKNIYINAKYLRINIHAVKVTLDKRVVNTTILEDKTSSLSIALAITKQVTVVGEASIIRIAISSWFLKPIRMAIGTKIAASRISFIKLAITVGLIFFMALLPSKLAPMQIRAIGVAV